MLSTSDEFQLKINRKDIAEITENTRQLRISDADFIRSAPYEDVMTAYVLLSLNEFLANRRVDSPFNVVLSE